MVVIYVRVWNQKHRLVLPHEYLTIVDVIALDKSWGHESLHQEATDEAFVRDRNKLRAVIA